MINTEFEIPPKVGMTENAHKWSSLQRVTEIIKKFILTIETQYNYMQALSIIETFLAKGSSNLTEADLANLQRLSLLVERYEDQHYPMPKIA